MGPIAGTRGQIDMKRAILARFIGIVILALVISGVISYWFVGNKMLDENIDSMIRTIHVIDYSLDYEGALQEELVSLHQNTLEDETRITIVDTLGTVIADTETEEPDELDNHLERAEIQHALSKGSGYATRYSTTLNQNMLYVAAISHHGDYIIRMSVPYTGIFDYIRIIFPMMFFGALIAFVISLFVAYNLAGKITRPLNEISEELKKVNSNDLDFHFKTYRFDELNVISQSTMRLSEEVREHLDSLEFQKKVRQEFFSNASHELKTPITSIKGYAELIDQGFVKDEETRQDFMHRILKETDNMTNLINDILMISRLETNEAEVTYSMIRLNPLLDEIFESLEPISADYEVMLHKECEPITIEASTKQLRELFMNLITNGIKYNHPGGNVWVRVFRQQDDLVLEVRDDGVGISEEDRERVFERFFRVDKGRSKKMGGTGLGLSIVKHIVEFYKGSVSLESRMGEGSTFTVKIPFERETDNTPM